MIRKLNIGERLAAVSTDKELGNAWAKSLADGILIAARKVDQPEDVRVFSDRTGWIAACFRDLLVCGPSQMPWWYGPLRDEINGMSLPEAAIHLLAREGSQSVHLLARLQAHGVLDKVLDALSPHERRSLLSLLGRTEPRDSTARDRLRPILAAALRILDLTHPPAQVEALLTEWIARDGISDPDWQDRRAMADALAAACHFIVRAMSIDVAMLTAAAHASPPAWVDGDRLRRSLVAVPTADASNIRAIATALYLALAEDAADPARLSLTAFARLAAAMPELAAMVPARRLVSASAPFLLRLMALPTDARHDAIAAYRRGTGPLSIDNVDAPHARSEIAAILECIVASQDQATIECESTSIGAAVMLRVLADVDLAGALARARASAPSLPEHPDLIAAALLCAWAGPAAVQQDGRLDAGLALLLGDDVPHTIGELGAALAQIDGVALKALTGVIEQTVTMQHRGVAAAPCDVAAFAGPPALHLPQAIGEMAALLLKHWSRWLQGFEHSSAQWLLERAVRRAGRVAIAGERLSITLSPLLLDVVLRRAGYLEPFAPPPWQAWRQVTFRLKD